MSAQDARTELFRTAWPVYDTIVEKNYMFHREIHALVDARLATHHAAGPCRMLDLGCGNARHLASCLAAHPPAAYDGVDLSRAALDDAAHRLAFLPRVTLHEGDMLAATRAFAAGRFEVVYSGFAVHHLDTPDKAALFQACAATLVPGGEFVLVDVAREDGQTREEYLAQYLGTMRSTWTAVDPAILEEACRHVEAHDFPETLPELLAMACQAGFRDARPLARFGAHHVLVLRR